MEATILNESEILVNAWQRYITNYSRKWSFGSAYDHARNDARTEAIHQKWKEEADQKQKAKIEAEEAEFEASGLDLHSYTMDKYYREKSGSYTGD